MNNFSIKSNQKRGNNRKSRFIQGSFVAGPLPLAWLELCGSLGGRCLHVAIHLWFLRGIYHDRQPFKVQPKALRRLGVSRFALHRALRKMNAAGLISFSTRIGVSPSVSILDFSTSSADLKPMGDLR